MDKHVFHSRKKNKLRVNNDRSFLFSFISELSSFCSSKEAIDIASNGKQFKNITIILGIIIIKIILRADAIKQLKFIY